MTRDKDVSFSLGEKIYFFKSQFRIEWKSGRIKEYVNANSLVKYDWFKEDENRIQTNHFCYGKWFAYLI